MAQAFLVESFRVSLLEVKISAMPISAMPIFGGQILPMLFLSKQILAMQSRVYDLKRFSFYWWLDMRWEA